MGIPLAVKAVLRPLHAVGIRTLARLEHRWADPTHRLRFPPLFIIGVPRSGTTLIYQLISGCLRVSYFTNFSCRYAESPVAATLLGRRLFGPYKPDYSSSYGRTNGPAAPHEGWPVWNRHFPKEYNAVDETYLPHESKRTLYATVAGIERVMNAPFVNKNVLHSVRVRALDDLFPGCLFIIVRRDRLAVARSILKGRLDLHGRLDAWTSVKPEEYDQIQHKPFPEQISGQIYFTELNMDADLASLGGDRILDLRYEEICQHPQSTLEKIVGFYREHGVDITQTSLTPTPFPISKGPPLSAEHEQALIDALEKTYAGH